jgi:hypothetical protein
MATLLTRHGGEYLLRLGARPPRTPLFANEDYENVNDWTGNQRTEAEVDAMIDHISQVVEEVGGKVLSAVEANPSSFLIKLSSGLYIITGRGTASSRIGVASIAST